MTTTTVCTIAIGLSALALIGHHRRVGWWADHRVRHAPARAGLSHEDRTLVTSALDGVRTDGADAARVRRRLRDRFREAIMADDLDVDALHATIDQEAAELATIGHRLVERAATLHRTLTPEQRARLGRRRHGL